MATVPGEGQGSVSARVDQGAVLQPSDRPPRIACPSGHAGGATCLDLSADGSLLASAGIDGQGRQEVAVWDVAGCWAAAGETSGAAGLRLLARSASGHNIQALRFVPWGLPGRLLSCGKNSVRVWHAKEGSLRGLSVPLSGETAAGVALQLGRHSLCGEAFTCVAFERAPASLAAEPRRAYVGTQSGAVAAGKHAGCVPGMPALPGCATPI